MFERQFIRLFFREVRRALYFPKLSRRHLPITESLERLSRKAKRIEPEGPFLAWGRQALNLSADEERSWFSRAWWGFHARNLVWNAIQQNRVEEVMNLVEPPDVSQLEHAFAQGRGAVLAGAHLGPVGINWHLLDRLDRHIYFLGSVHEPKGLRIKYLMVSVEAERKRSLAACLLHLRRNRAVMIPADGRWGSCFRPYSFLNHSVAVSIGTARLAKMAMAPTLWFFTLWDVQQKRIRVIIEDAGLDPGRAEEDWEIVWISAYLRRLAEIMVHEPENLGFAGGFWNASKGGFLTML
jgi:lauroyl/myristoyl acyltransferase